MKISAPKGLFIFFPLRKGDSLEELLNEERLRRCVMAVDSALRYDGTLRIGTLAQR